MPQYVITTRPRFTRRNDWPGTEERTTVDSLDEALGEVSTTVCNLMAGENFGQYQDEFRAIDESGGTIGPLPDGTIIEVRPA
jgi:hypothetical protein